MTPDTTLKALAAIRRGLFLISTPMVFLSFALPLRARELGASALEIGGLFSIFTAALLVLRPLVGIGLDRFGRRWFFVAALAFYIVTNGIFALSEDLASLYFGRLVQGVGLALLLITTDTMTADLTTAESRAAALGRNVESQGRGGMAGAFLGFTLVGVVPVHAWQLTFSSFALVAAVAVAFAIRTVPETTEPTVRARFTWRFEVPPQQERLLLVIFIAAFATSLIQPLYLIYLQDRFGVELRVLAFAFLPVGIVYAVLPSRLGALAQRLGRSRSMASGWLLTGTLYLALPHMPGLAAIALGFTISAVGMIMADIARNAWVADMSTAETTGRSYGVVELAAGVGATIGPLVGGLIYDVLGKDLVFYTNGVIMWLAAILVMLYVAKPEDGKTSG